MKSFRVFVWPSLTASHLELVAFEHGVGAWDAEALRSGDLVWLRIKDASQASLSEALRDLDALLPTDARIHAFASPLALKAASDLPEIREKKLLQITNSSGLKDYSVLSRFFASGVSYDESLGHCLSAFAELSDREIENRLRRFGERPMILEALAPDPERRTHLIEKSRRPQKLLLHVCCGPDAAGVVQQLKNEFALTCFWYDPNIQPQQEHDKRLAAFEKVMRIENVPYLVGEYDVDAFLDKIRGLEHTPEQGAKCSKCYDMRLERAAFEAREGAFDLYATTLAISPHKVQQKLVAFGELNEKRYGVPYFHRNFMKDDGFVDSVDYTKKHGIFRQDYCGCWFSLHEGGPAAKWLGAEVGLAADSRIAPATLSDTLFKDYESRLEANEDSGYSGG